MKKCFLKSRKIYLLTNHFLKDDDGAERLHTGFVKSKISIDPIIHDSCFIALVALARSIAILCHNNKISLNICLNNLLFLSTHSFFFLAVTTLLYSARRSIVFGAMNAHYNSNLNSHIITRRHRSRCRHR